MSDDLRQMYNQMSRDYESDVASLGAEVRELQAERDGLAATLAKAQTGQLAIHTAWVNSHDEWLKRLILEQDKLLAQSPADALAAHDAEVAARARDEVTDASEELEQAADAIIAEWSRWLDTAFVKEHAEPKLRALVAAAVLMGKQRGDYYEGLEEGSAIRHGELHDAWAAGFTHAIGHYRDDKANYITDNPHRVKSIRGGSAT